MNRRRLDRPRKFLLAFALSMGLHGSLLGVVLWAPHPKGWFAKEQNTKSTETKILVDLRDLSETEEVPREDTPFVSQVRRELKGRLTAEEGILVPGLSASSVSSSLASSDGGGGSVVQPPLQRVLAEEGERASEGFASSSDGLRGREGEGEARGEPHSNRRERTSSRELVTKTAKPKFAFDFSDEPQVGSLEEEHADFYLAFSRVIRQRFLLYVGDAHGMQLLKGDQVTGSGAIHKDGTIRFGRVVSTSPSQPYLHYLIGRIIDNDNPGLIQSVPESLFPRGGGPLRFEITLLFTGLPENQWWCSYRFLTEGRADD